MNFGMELKRIRQYHKMKQSELGEKVGLSEKAISTYENNMREPKLSVLVKFSDIFDVSLDQLIGRKRQAGNQFPVVDVNDRETQEMIKFYMTLSKDDKEKVRAIIKTLAELDATAQSHNTKKNGFAG